MKCSQDKSDMINFIVMENDMSRFVLNKQENMVNLKGQQDNLQVI